MLISASLLLAVLGTDDPARSLEPLLERVRAQHDVPALGALLWADGAVHALGAVGVRRAGEDEAVTVDDRWHLAACAQTVTGTLVAALAARDQVAWDTTLGETFGDLRADMFPGYREVSLELVLTHAAGLPFLPRRFLQEALGRTGASGPMQRRRVVEDVLARRPAYVPGTRVGYSHAGYTIVGAALETLVGESYEVLVQREVFDRLGMRSAGFGAPGSGVVVDEPWGHLVVDGVRTPVAPGPDADLPAAFAPTSSVHCTLRDAAKLVALHLALARGDDTPYSQAVAGRMSERRSGHYALGWLVTELDAAGGLVLSHSGGNQRWFASFTLLPEDDVAVIVTCNQGGRASAAACRDAAAALLGTMERGRSSTSLTPSERPSERPRN